MRETITDPQRHHSAGLSDSVSAGVPARVAGAPVATVPEPLPPGFIHQLRFDQLRSLTALSVSATGGGLVALQAGLLDRSPLIAIPLVCFALAAIVALIGQRQLVTELERTGTVSRTVMVVAQAAEGLLGAGVGGAVALLALL
jgi:hypothetical protein